MLVGGEVPAGQPLDLEAEFAQSFLSEVDLPMFFLKHRMISIILWIQTLFIRVAQMTRGDGCNGSSSTVCRRRPSPSRESVMGS